MRESSSGWSVTSPSDVMYTSTQSPKVTRRVAHTQVIKRLPAKRPPKRINNLPAVCGVRELAAYWGIGKNTAYDLVKFRKIPAVRVGRQYRIRKEAVLEYLEGKK